MTLHSSIATFFSVQRKFGIIAGQELGGILTSPQDTRLGGYDQAVQHVTEIRAFALGLILLVIPR